MLGKEKYGMYKTTDGMTIAVQILSTKRAYGHTRFKITPVQPIIPYVSIPKTSLNFRWVNEEKVKLL